MKAASSYHPSTPRDGLSEKPSRTAWRKSGVRDTARREAYTGAKQNRPSRGAKPLAESPITTDCLTSALRLRASDLPSGTKVPPT